MTPPATLSPDALAAAIDAVGRDRIVSETELDPDAVAAVASGDADGIDLRDAAGIVALAEGDDPGAVLAEVREELMLAMSAAVLDVETLAAELGGDLDPREVGAKLEGRLPMTVGEYARVRDALADRTR